MSGSILIDTNIFIYLTQGDKNVIEYLQNKDVGISFISELELLSFKNITTDEEFIIKEIIDQLKIFNYNDSLKQQIIFLRKKYNLKLPSRQHYSCNCKIL